MSRSRVVVLHALRDDSRATTISHAACFGRYISDYKVEYINVFGELPTNKSSDLVIVTYELVELRNLPIWIDLVDRMQPFLQNSKLRVLMPQDDYSRSAVLDEFIVAQNFDFVFTPATKDLERLYPRSFKQGVKFREALTGYFDESNGEYWKNYSKPFRERTVDLGQRVRLLPPNFGDVAGRKGRLAVAFAKQAENAGFICDVSTNPEDVFVGDAWWSFLGNSKFTVSRRGGASMTDPTGRLADRVRRFQMRYPNASMDEVRKGTSLRGGLQGDFSAISPRLFEAAALGVCQILEPGDYVDGFEPWVHYIPLSEDFSNIGAVFQCMRDLDRCTQMVKASQDILLSSGKFSYASFVEGFRKEINLESGPTGVFGWSDSSDGFDGVSGQTGDALRWVQDYVVRAYLQKRITEAINSLSDGNLLILDSSDVKWADHAVAQRSSMILWLEAFLAPHFPIESFVFPWRTLTSLVSS